MGGENRSVFLGGASVGRAQPRGEAGSSSINEQADAVRRPDELCTRHKFQVHRVGQEARARLLSRRVAASVSSALPGGIWSAGAAETLAIDAHLRETSSHLHHRHATRDSRRSAQGTAGSRHGAAVRGTWPARHVASADRDLAAALKCPVLRLH